MDVAEEAESLPDRLWRRHGAIHGFRRCRCCNLEWAERRQGRRVALIGRCGAAGRRSRGIRWRRRCCSVSSSDRCRDPATSSLHFRTTPVNHVITIFIISSQQIKNVNFNHFHLKRTKSDWTRPINSFSWNRLNRAINFLDWDFWFQIQFQVEAPRKQPVRIHQLNSSAQNGPVLHSISDDERAII